MHKTLKKEVKAFMTKKVISITENQPIKKLFSLMDENGIVGVPVVNDVRQVVGMITETDLIEHFTTLETPRSINLLGGIVYLDDPNDFNQHLKDQCAETVKDLMTQPAITIQESDNLSEAIDLMSEHQIGRLPVVNDKNELTGIITRSDVLHQLAKIKNI